MEKKKQNWSIDKQIQLRRLLSCQIYTHFSPSLFIFWNWTQKSGPVINVLLIEADISSLFVVRNFSKVKLQSRKGLAGGEATEKIPGNN